MLLLLEPGPHTALGVLKHWLPGFAPVLVIFKCTIGALVYENGLHAYKTIASIRAAAMGSLAAVSCWLSHLSCCWHL